LLEGENLAGLIGELLQALLETLTPPFTAFGHDFAFDVGQTRKRFGCGLRFGCGFHVTTRLPWWLFLPVKEPLHLKS
jgi:hypothetical protein